MQNWAPKFCLNSINTRNWTLILTGSTKFIKLLKKCCLDRMTWLIKLCVLAKRVSLPASHTMGRRKRSDVNRTANFAKGDEDQPTKKPRKRESAPSNSVSNGRTLRQAVDGQAGAFGWRRDVSVPTKNLVAGIKSRFRLKLERDS